MGKHVQTPLLTAERAQDKVVDADAVLAKLWARTPADPRPEVPRPEPAAQRPAEITDDRLMAYEAIAQDVVLTVRLRSEVYDSIENVEPFNALPRAIDNDDPGYTQDGHFRYTTSEGYLGDERSAETIGVTGNENIARWTFSGVTDGFYRVAATWVPGVNRATDATFRVLDETGTPISPILTGGGGGAISPIDQRIAPDDFSDAGGDWETLSNQSNTLSDDPTQDLLFEVPAGTNTLIVELPYSSVANGFVMADAVRIERINGVDPTDLAFTPPAPAPNPLPAAGVSNAGEAQAASR